MLQNLQSRFAKTGRNVSQLIKKNYSSLAVFYPVLMRNIDYSLWAKYLLEITGRYNLNVNSVLELGGGNGKLAKILSRKIPNYFLSDKSQFLLERSKIQKNKIVCDMIALPFRKHFDFVFAAFDTVNYLTSKKGFTDLLSVVSTVLKEDGSFTFDVSLEKNSLPHRSGEKKSYNHLDKKIIHQSTYNEAKRIHINEFSFYQNGKLIEKEIHKQKIFPFDFYLKEIEKSNFYIVDCLEAFGFRRGKPDSKRVQFILKKVSPNASI